MAWGLSGSSLFLFAALLLIAKRKQIFEFFHLVELQNCVQCMSSDINLHWVTAVEARLRELRIFNLLLAEQSVILVLMSTQVRQMPLRVPQQVLVLVKWSRIKSVNHKRLTISLKIAQWDHSIPWKIDLFIQPDAHLSETTRHIAHSISHPVKCRELIVSNHSGALHHREIIG